VDGKWKLITALPQKYTTHVVLNVSRQQFVVSFKVSKDTDLIQFWLDNKFVLPKSQTVARKVVCVPASSAASERVFSTAGRLLEKRRTNWSPATVNSLLFLHSNME